MKDSISSYLLKNQYFIILHYAAFYKNKSSKMVANSEFFIKSFCMHNEHIEHHFDRVDQEHWKLKLTWIKLLSYIWINRLFIYIHFHSFR